MSEKELGIIWILQRPEVSVVTLPSMGTTRKPELPVQPRSGQKPILIKPGEKAKGKQRQTRHQELDELNSPIFAKGSCKNVQNMVRR